MDLYEAIAIATFIMVTIMMIGDYIDSTQPKVSDVLGLMNLLPTYEIKAYKDGKRLKYAELIGYITSPVKGYSLKDGILYIEIY